MGQTLHKELLENTSGLVEKTVIEKIDLTKDFLTYLFESGVIRTIDCEKITKGLFSSLVIPLTVAGISKGKVKDPNDSIKKLEKLADTIESLFGVRLQIDLNLT